MVEAVPLDIPAAHRYFAPACFNTAWDFIEKKDRSEKDDQMMIAMAHASIFHWLNRADCTDRNLAVGYWQASRIHALLANPHEAARLGEISLSYSRDLLPFFQAYAHEALARAHKLMGNKVETARHLAAALELLALVEDEENRHRLEADLQELGAS